MREMGYGLFLQPDQQDVTRLIIAIRVYMVLIYHVAFDISSGDKNSRKGCSGLIG